MDRPWYAFYDKDVPRSIAYPNVTLKELFNRNAENNPDRPHLIFKDSTLPYRICNSMARRLANGFLGLGIKKGDRVALMMPNIPNIQASWLTVGKDTAQLCLHAGANDFGSIMIEENVVRVAGATHTFNAEGIQQAIRDAGFEPSLRDQDFNPTPFTVSPVDQK